MSEDDSDSFSIKMTSLEHAPRSFSKFQGNLLAEQVQAAMRIMKRPGIDVEKDYQSCLKPLRKRAAEVVGIIEAEFKDSNETAYLRRRSLVQLLGDLKHPASLPILDEILSSEIPPERAKSDDGNSGVEYSTVHKEIVIRLTAIQALGRLSGMGKREAQQMLLKHTTHKNFSVKLACVHTLIEQGGAKARNTLLRTLPVNERYLLDIHPFDVRILPPIIGGTGPTEPESFLAPGIHVPFVDRRLFNRSSTEDSPTVQIERK